MPEQQGQLAGRAGCAHPHPYHLAADLLRELGGSGISRPYVPVIVPPIPPVSKLRSGCTMVKVGAINQPPLFPAVH